MAKLEIFAFVIIIGVFIWAFIGWLRESKRIPIDEEINLDNYIKEVKSKILEAESQSVAGIAQAESRLIKYKAQLEIAIERKKQLEII